ncbi:MAG: hypothetical protein E7665_01720 [Ruminococcaceae bacterium]|nr:hypothetical protein [Oscillospiraceae bacterium]
MTESDDPQKYEKEVDIHIRSYRRASHNILKESRHLISMTDELNARLTDLTKGKNRKLIPAPPANSVIDLAEQKSRHFASGLNMYKILLICFIGSFLGVVIEMIWCLLRNGYIESRAGLVYGPFNLLYGAGAAVLSAALYKFRNKGSWLSFGGGMIVGSAVEYVCSFLQELAFGSRSWDYSEMPFNINGRICLLYSVFWGILGAFWIKSVYPRMAKLILKLPDKAGKIIIWILVVFLIINAIVTVIAVMRWSERIEGIPADSGFWEFVDARFPDSRMEKIFANMDFASAD